MILNNKEYANIINHYANYKNILNNKLTKYIDIFWNNMPDINQLENHTFGCKISKNMLKDLNAFKVKTEFDNHLKLEEQDKEQHISRKNFISLPHGLVYGDIPNTLAPDNDPIDVLVLQPYNESSIINSSVYVVPVLCLEMSDHNFETNIAEEDNKIITIPVTDLYYFITVGKKSIVTRIMNFIDYILNMNYNVLTKKNMIMYSCLDYFETNQYIKKYTCN